MLVVSSCMFVARRSSTPLYDDLKRQVRAYFTDEGIAAGKHKCDWGAWARYGFFAAMFALSFVGWLNGEWWTLVSLPWFYWMGGSGLMHSGSHWALSKSVFINCCGAYAGSLHVSVLHWYHQHVIGHHCHTNIVDMDPDLTHFQHCDEPGPGYRLHADQPWMEKYFDWRKAMPMQAWFATSGPSLINQMKYLVEEKFVRPNPKILAAPIPPAPRELDSNRALMDCAGLHAGAEPIAGAHRVARAGSAGDHLHSLRAALQDVPGGQGLLLRDVPVRLPRDDLLRLLPGPKRPLSTFLGVIDLHVESRRIPFLLFCAEIP